MDLLKTAITVVIVGFITGLFIGIATGYEILGTYSVSKNYTFTGEIGGSITDVGEDYRVEGVTSNELIDTYTIEYIVVGMLQTFFGGDNSFLKKYVFEGIVSNETYRYNTISKYYRFNGVVAGGYRAFIADRDG